MNIWKTIRFRNIWRSCFINALRFNQETHWTEYLTFVLDNIDNILNHRFSECKKYTIDIDKWLSNNFDLTTTLLSNMGISLDKYDIVKPKPVLLNNREYVKIKRHLLNKCNNVYLLSDTQGYAHNDTLNLVFGFEYGKNVVLMTIDKLAKDQPMMSNFFKMFGCIEK